MQLLGVWLRFGKCKVELHINFCAPNSPSICLYVCIFSDPKLWHVNLSHCYLPACMPMHPTLVNWSVDCIQFLPNSSKLED